MRGHLLTGSPWQAAWLVEAVHHGTSNFPLRFYRALEFPQGGHPQVSTAELSLPRLGCSEAMEFSHPSSLPSYPKISPLELRIENKHQASTLEVG